MDSEQERLLRVLDSCERSLARLSDTPHAIDMNLLRDIRDVRQEALRRLVELDPHSAKPY